jgi:hypothetical protein
MVRSRRSRVSVEVIYTYLYARYTRRRRAPRRMPSERGMREVWITGMSCGDLAYRLIGIKRSTAMAWLFRALNL